MDERNSCVFIPSNRRCNNEKTIPYLRKHGYDGKIFIVCDDQDPTINQYRNKYGDMLVVFNKEKYSWVDTCDNDNSLRGVVYARNAIQDIAKSLKITHYLVIDDDTCSICFRVDKDGNYSNRTINHLRQVFEAMFDFLDKTNTQCIAFSQGGEFFGGSNNASFKRGFKRKAMNSFFCRTDRNIPFIGRANEDVNAYMLDGIRGNIYITTFNICLNQEITQTNSGGLTEQYRNDGTYRKSFYSVICAPSCCKISVIGSKFTRIHHKINSLNAYPMIISEQFRRVA